MNRVTDRTSLMAFVTEAEQIILKYGWQKKETRPYPNCPITAEKIVADCKDYDICTRGSREYLIMLAEGFRKILEAWVRYEEEPLIRVRITEGDHAGDIKEIHKSLAELLVESGFAKVIK